ncbi:MAG: hypothetical protein BGO13_00995 [Burkholderiales bacterium 66-5]|nr:MAG: hypothetical protein BGO13_00995 [Burkholderiales bacterium 66-5]
MVEAMVDVVMDQGTLCRRYRAFYRRELAGNVKARLFCLNHADDIPKVALGTLEPFHQARMA